MSSLTVALVLGVLFLAYDIALDRGADLPGGDLRLLALTVYVVLVLVVGAFVTWLVVPLPTGASATRRTRTPWSLALGLFAAVPIAYLVLVVLHEIDQAARRVSRTAGAGADIIEPVARPKDSRG